MPHISPLQREVLNCVKSTEDSLTAVDIADKTGRPTELVQEAISQLSPEMIVDEGESPQNAILELTEEGRQMADK